MDRRLADGKDDEQPHKNGCRRAPRTDEIQGEVAAKDEGPSGNRGGKAVLQVARKSHKLRERGDSRVPDETGRDEVRRKNSEFRDDRQEKSSPRQANTEEGGDKEPLNTKHVGGGGAR